MSKRKKDNFTSISIHESLRDKLMFIAKTQNKSMNKALDDILSPILQIVAGFKPNTVLMASQVRVLSSEVYFSFYGKSIYKTGSTKVTEDIMSVKLEKVTEK